MDSAAAAFSQSEPIYTPPRCSTFERHASSSVSSDECRPQQTRTAFKVLSEKEARCLLESDKKRDTSLDGASTGWTGWVDDASAQTLKLCLDEIRLVGPNQQSHQLHQPWLRWLQSAPTPIILDVSLQLRQAVQKSLANEQNRSPALVLPGNHTFGFLERIALNLISLPSGSTLSNNLVAPPGALAYGKLLQGGVTRFRLIRSSRRPSSAAPAAVDHRPLQPKRRVGERRAIVMGQGTPDTIPGEAWLQYGGPERNYESADIGHCLLLELILLPQGLQWRHPHYQEASGRFGSRDMRVETLDASCWNMSQLLEFGTTTAATNNQTVAATTRKTSGLVSSVCDLDGTFCTGLGGLRPQVDEIVRRVLDGRVMRSASDSIDGTPAQRIDQVRRQEMTGLLELGLKPVRGLLLYGPPGVGKTALAREISYVLDARPPKIVAAPELLDKWVGGSERKIRELFADAEAELSQCDGDPSRSALHLVVIDEIDAVFRKRGGVTSYGGGSSDATRASAVNQILAKLDGVKPLDNLLLVGMTNRRDLLDPALMRPGRLEVQIQLGIPDRHGRREILQIHFDALRKYGRLSQPLVNAVYGDKDVDASWLHRTWRTRKRLGFWSAGWWRTGNFNIDLSADAWTGGFTGADIAGLVRNAGSVALSRARKQGDGDLSGFLITLDDVLLALKEEKVVTKSW